MTNTTLKHVRIKGVSVVVPPKELRLADDVTLYNGNQKQLKRVIKSSGFDRRRVVEKNVTAADLCESAAQRLMRDMEIDPHSIDAIVFVSQRPDYPMPATACVLQHKLKLSMECAAFDVNQGCAGYTYGLWIASMMVQTGCKRVLLLVGDTSSKYTDMFAQTKAAPIFGDAGSATLLEFDEKAPPIYFDIGNDGSQYDAIIAENGGFRNPPTRDAFLEDGCFDYKSHMDGLRVMEFTLLRVPESILRLFAYAQKPKENVDYFVLHQANKLILGNIAANADIPSEKMPLETLSKYGNQSCASIPGAMCDALVEPLSQKALTLCLCGFGIGLSWVSVLLETDKIYCSGIHDFEGVPK